MCCRRDADRGTANFARNRCWPTSTNTPMPTCRRSENILEPAGSPSWMPAADGGSPEKKTLYYRERNEMARNAFLQQIRNIPSKNLVHLDESGIGLGQYQITVAYRGTSKTWPLTLSKDGAVLSATMQPSLHMMAR